VQQLTLLSQNIGSLGGEFSKAAQKVGEGCYISKKIQRKMYLESQEPKKKKLKETSIHNLFGQQSAMTTPSLVHPPIRGKHNLSKTL
jgi:hypothetical protein